jgi:exodeoxyribonuclease VII large subunit
VRVVSGKIAEWIARLGPVWIDGEVAQLSRRPGTSMVFLTLRDPSADVSLQVTAWRSVFDACNPPLTEGARVVVHAKPEVYTPRGTLSLRADELRQVGLGELLARLEKLKQLLAAEGLFAPARKRKPPFLPNRIGLITGRASAAERDVHTNAERRWPAVQFTTINTPVQGGAAVPAIVEALRVLDADPEIDVIIIARGGGSVEDLLPFSDEALCRAVANCRTPVISAIGHEPDTPLLDFVADLRASTPTDAAKRVVPDLAEELRGLAVARARLDRGIGSLLEREQQRIAAWRSRPVLARPEVLVETRQIDIDALRARANRTLGHRLDQADGELLHTLARLRGLSPAATLQRGYAIVQRPDGHVVRAAHEISPGEIIRIRLNEGELTAKVDA